MTAARRVPHPAPRPVVVLLMGVCGCGKTTIGRRLAGVLGWPFCDADDLHPPANVAKMASGRPLEDRERRPWLAAVRAEIDRLLAAGDGGVVACSALKRAHRAALGAGRPGVRLVHLTGDPGLLAERLRGRRGHFMPPELLASQLATLEPPARALVIDVAPPAGELARRIAAELGLAAAPGCAAGT